MKAADRAFVESLRSDERAGATAIVARAAAFLADGERDRAELVEIARACAAAQPAMAGLRTMLTIAGESAEPKSALRHLFAQVQRAPRDIARHASALLRLGLQAAPGGRPALTLVTCSASAAVFETCVRLAADVDLTVRCAESRPKCEGAAQAVDLDAAGLRVELYTDAGISAAVPSSDVVVMGADALGPDVFVNKVGSAALCALATIAGVPVYVLAGREKLLSASEFGELAFPVRSWSASETEESAAASLRQNPTFERVSRDLVTQLITDRGVAV